MTISPSLLKLALLPAGQADDLLMLVNRGRKR